MITTIKQRIYVFGLLPLAVLAVSLVLSNGFSRVEDANRELTTSREVTAALLQSPALDALVLGDTFHFEQAVKAVMRTSPALRCVLLRDAMRRTVTRTGQCDNTGPGLEYFPIREPVGNGLSDYEERSSSGRVMGEAGLLMNDPNIVHKRQVILAQLGLSLILIALVLMVTGRLLRARLITPIGRIGGAMQALSKRDYTVRVPMEGNDELTRLAEALNNTIATVAEYTRELERRRSEADQALQDADAANLTRDGLVRSLTEDLAEPMSSMHSRLTAIAMANTDPELKEDIKSVMALLQDAQSDFADLIEIATQAERTRTAPWLEATEMWADIERDIQRLSETEAIPINFVVTHMASAKGATNTQTGVLLNIDGVRLKKAILYLVRALGRQRKDTGVHVNAELIRFSAERLHVSVHIVAFREAGSQSPATPWVKGMGPSGNELPSAVGLTDRESKMIGYLLRAIGSTPTVSVSNSGAVNVLLDVTCPYTVEQARPQDATDWMFAAAPISAALVSNDLSLLRYTTRGDVSNHELKLVTFMQALSNPSDLQGQHAVLMDISDDMGEVLRLLDVVRTRNLSLPPLIAICPPGVMSDVLTNRLLELGFVGMLQKPLQYSRMAEIIRATLSVALSNAHLGGTFRRPDGDIPQ
jgi:HAMP domain-containing protein